jgi:hypothetical protein
MMHPDETDPRSEEQTDATTGETVEPDEPGSQEPDEDAGPAVEPIEGDQGEYVEQTPAQAGASQAGFDPDRPVADSPPPPDRQSGVPPLPENEGLEGQPEFARGTDPAQASIHSEESITDDPEAAAEETEEAKANSGRDEQARADHQPSVQGQGRKVG